MGHNHATPVREEKEAEFYYMQYGFVHLTAEGKRLFLPLKSI
jgi:hypothetical protein